MRLFNTILGLFLLTVSVPHAAEYTLNYQNQNKWLVQADKAPLLAARDAIATQPNTPVTVYLPSENKVLAIKRLEIVAEILGRKAPQLMLQEDTAKTAPANSIVLEIK